jgi:hypothetical protein
MHGAKVHANDMYLTAISFLEGNTKQKYTDDYDDGIEVIPSNDKKCALKTIKRIRLLRSNCPTKPPVFSR